MAETVSKNSLDFGYTNNATFVKDAPKSDFFLRAQTANAMLKDRHRFGFGLGYTDYFSQNAEDVLSLRLSDRLRVSPGKWKPNAALLGQLYPNGNPGTTDGSFNNFGFDLGATKDRALGHDVTLDYGGGYRFRYFPNFSGRNDHTVFAGIAVEKDYGNRLVLGGRAESGLLMSTLSDYSRVYFDLSGNAETRLSDRWTLNGDIGIKESVFTNRTVSVVTEVSQRRGVRVTSSRNESEMYSLIYFGSELMRRESEMWRWGFALNGSSQSSRSGLQDYNALEILARLMMIF